MTSLLAVLALAAAAAAPAPAPAPMSEAQAAGALNAIDRAEGDLGDFMAGSTQRPEVKVFAARQVEEHAALDRDVALAVSRLGLQAEDSPVAASTTRDAAAALDKLKKANAPARDQIYLDQEVRAERGWLEAIDGVLAPGAKRAEIRALVTAARACVARDLAAARRLQRRPG